MLIQVVDLQVLLSPVCVISVLRDLLGILPIEQLCVLVIKVYLRVAH